MGEFSANVIIRKGLLTDPSDHNLHANHTVPTENLAIVQGYNKHLDRRRVKSIHSQSTEKIAYLSSDITGIFFEINWINQQG